MKPVRTLSGVTTVTVLTKPYPCPGKCIFCPTDVRMPKSYLPDEPGAMRGLQNDFDPFRQVASRLEALRSHRPPHRQDRAAHPGRHLELPTAAITRNGSSSAASTRSTGRRSTSLAEAQRLNETAAAPQRGSGDRDPPGRDQPQRTGLAAPPGRHQGADGRAVPGRPHPGAQPARAHRRRDAAGLRLAARRRASRSSCTGCPTCSAPRPTSTGRTSPACGRTATPPTRSRSIPASCSPTPSCTLTGSAASTIPTPPRN